MSTRLGTSLYFCAIILFFNSSITFSDVKINLENTPWYFETISDWASKPMKLSINNNTKVPRKVEGIRFTMPNKPSEMVSYNNPVANVNGPVSDGNGTDRYNLRVSGMNNAGTAHLNLISNGGNLGVTLTTTGIKKAKDFTPFDFQYLVKTGTWAVDKGYKDAKGITLEQVKSIIEEPWYYDSTLYIADSLGIRGGPNSGGFIDTWYDQENDIPVWQVQIGLSDTKFQVNGEHLKFSPGLMGEKHPNWHPVLGGAGPMYLMGLVMMQEYMNFDMQLFAANATNEKQAGCLKFAYDNSGQPVVEDGSSYLPNNDAQQMGPFNYMETSYWQYIYKGFPKFFPFENSPTNSTEYVTTPNSGGACVGNSPQIANACLISSLYCWYLYELMFNSTEFWAADLFSNAKDELVAAKIMYQAWRYGMEDDVVSGISTLYDRDALLNADDVSTLFSNNGYFDLFKPALDVILEGCKYSKTSPNSKGYDIYDYPLSLDYFRHLLFGVNNEDPDNGILGDAGILWHFDLTDEQRIEIWETVKAAFDIVKGKAPSVSGEYVSFRYDYLLMLRVVKYFLDLERPIPTEVHFLDLVEKHSDDSNVVGDMTGIVIENKYPYLVKKDRGILPNNDFYIDIKAEDETWLEIDTGAVVEWTLDSNWGYWTAAELIPGTKDSSLKAEYKIVIDSATIANTFNGKSGIGWVRVNDRCFNSTIDTFRIAGVKYPSLQEASALDKDGDGFADSICLKITMGTDDGADSLKAFTKMEYAWPNVTPLNNLVLTNVNINSQSIEFDIDKSNGFGFGIINMNYPSKEGLSVNVEDKVGPAINADMKPQYIIPAEQSDKDTFYVTFTESIQNLPASGLYLAFRGSDSIAINAEQIIKVNSNYYKFIFNNDTLSQFSEVKIISTSDLKDSVGNLAANYNQWVPFNTKGKNEPSFVFASIKDNVGDGYGNFITYKIKKGSDVPEAFSLNDLDSLTYKWNSNGTETSVDLNSLSSINETVLDFTIDIDANGIYGDGVGKAYMHFMKENKPYDLSGEIIDSVGPAILLAKYIEGKSGSSCSLNVTFTEPIANNLDPDNNYFIINGNNISQSAIIKQSNNEWTFIVNEGTIDAKSGDEFNITLIYNSGLTDDSPQKNPPLESNQEKKISIVVLNEIKLLNVAYTEITVPRDGLIDMISVSTDTSVSFEFLNEIKDYIKLNESRSFIIDDIIPNPNNKGFLIAVTQDENSEINTATTNNDKLEITQDCMSSEGALIYAQTLDIDDEIAPVIKNAHVLPAFINKENFDKNPSDTLLVTFSEKVMEGDLADNPFICLDDNDDEFSVDLEKVDWNIDSTTMTFLINTTGDKLTPGDFIKLSTSGEAKDSIDNVQDIDNKKVPVTFGKFSYDWNMVVYPNPVDISDKGDKNSIKENLETYLGNVEIENSLVQAFIIDPWGTVTEADSYSFNLVLFDGLGTVIIDKQRLKFLEDKQIWYFIWDLRNIKKRNVGSGVYTGYIEVLKDGEKVMADLKLSVGVKY